ncbi:SusC/RagA family TonB-linked outer membrane protein [Maribacter sp. 2210JD10-5]|uniref:SusC/RagA family TonB-linked outer membrane protein n=1 Tax=Maribacter sp. 2210JD10-5 TaxID=3386272 RepID=UPI0039BC68A0
MKNNNDFWKRIFPFLFFLFGFCAPQLYAQEKVTGQIVDEEGVPLPGVAVVVEGTTRGVVSDFDGNYDILAKEGETLVFSYIGFSTIKKKIGTSKKIDVQLQPDAKLLDEVVVVGYGTLEKKELTGSQVSLKSEDINKIQAVSFEEALQGKAAGVLITTSQGGPGDAATIQIRGATSINASSAPLYVIDGVEIDGDPIGTGGAQETGATAVSSPLSLIDPNNIKSIDVLKDANATAIYGSRGANGVVIIQTKSGKGSEQKVTMDLDITTGVQTISNQIDLLSAQEYVDQFREAFPWNPSNTTTTFEQLAFRDNNGRPLPLDDVQSDGTPRFGIRDFRNEIFRPAILNKYSLSARTGNANSWFSGNISYTDQEGIVKSTDYSRIQASVNIGANITPRLQIGVQASGGRSARSGIVSAAPDGGGRGGFGVITNLALAPPVQGRFDRSRNGINAANIVRDESGFVTSVGGRFVINPVQQVNETVSNGAELFGYISSYLEYKLADGLKFRSSVSFNSYGNRGRVYLPRTFGFGQITGGIATISSFDQTRWQSNNTLTFDKLFADKHKINVVLGTSVLSSETHTQNTRATEFQSDSVNLDDIGAGTNIDVNTNRQENGLLGIFGRINYAFDSRYILNVTARTDKSSRFFPGSTQWGFFPSAGFTWNASEESFLKDVSFLSNLRFKGSIGQSGNDKIGVFQSQLAFQSSRFFEFRNGFSAINAAAVRNGSRANGFFLSRVSNPDLTWETTTQYDIGGEIGLFNNRLNIGVDWFQKDTKDLLLERPTASQSGFSFILENVGEVQNKGFEVSVSSVNVNTPNFKWNTDFNISYVENEVVSLGGVQEEFTITSAVGRSVSNDFIVREGEPLGSIYGFESDGVYQFSDFVEFDGLSDAEAIALYRNNPDGSLRPFGGDFNGNTFTLKEGVPRSGNPNTNRPGQQKLRDRNGDGIIDEGDLTIIGDTNPHHFGGMTNSFRYKSWDLSIAMNWKYGNDIYNKNNFVGFSTNQFLNKYGVARERWTPNNTDTDIHSLRGRVREEGFGTVSDFVEDGSFLRLQNITLGYNLPDNVVDRLGLAQLRFYTAADNLHVWTNYSGYDPDVSVSPGALTTGVDFDAYPKAITFRFGIRATF